MAVNRNLLIGLAFIIIIVLGAGLRLLTLRFNSFLEPDVYEYFSVGQQTLANHLVITSAFSGIPPIQFNEQPGLIYLAVIPTLITGNLFNTMLIIPVLFAIGEMICIYILAFRISDNKWMALFAMLLFATLNAAVLKNSAGEWRGESFIPLFVMVALIISINPVKNKRQLMINNILVLLLMLISYLTWNGGIYMVPVIGFLYLLVFVARQPTSKEWHRVAAISIICILAVAGALIWLGFPSYAVQQIILEQEPFTIGAMLNNFGIVLVLALCGAAFLIKKKDLTDASYAVLALFFVTLGIQITEVRWGPLLAPAACILAAYFVFGVIKSLSRSTVLSIGIISMFFLLSLFMMQLPLFNPSGINTQFIQAAQWINSSTSKNSSILTLWPDGSVVEGITQRPVFTDSMMAAPRLWTQLPDFLYATAGNLTLLQTLQPDYFVVRQFWLNETSALELEGNLSQYSAYQGTNFQALENESIDIPIVYSNNDSIIYCFAACGK